MSTGPLVSIVIPVKNGGGRLEHCLESLKQQDFPPHLYEIIVADGRSTDDTVAIARRYGCSVVDNPRRTVAGGRNVGVALARGTYIAFSEDDIVLPENWLSEGVRALADSSVAAVGGPTPIPTSSTAFARAVDVIFRIAASSGYSVQSGVRGELRAVEDIPGGNAMYRRAALGSGPPMDEGLITGEDVDLHCRLRSEGYTLLFCPTFVAWHHKRDAPGRFFTQIRRFAQGRLQVGRRHKSALRPLHWFAALAPITLLAVAAMAPQLAALALAIACGSIVVLGLATGLGVAASLWLPVTVGIFSIAWPIGFFKELLRPTRDATGR